MQRHVRRIRTWQMRVMFTGLVADVGLLGLMVVKWADLSLLWVNQINNQFVFPGILLWAALLSVSWQAWLAWTRSRVQPSLKSLAAGLLILRRTLYFAAISSLAAAYTAGYGLDNQLIVDLLGFLVIDFGAYCVQQVLRRKVTLAISGKLHP